MREIKAEGKTVTMAVENGLRELGLRRDQVEVQVLEENSGGFLGLGSKPARVLLREKIWDPEEAARRAAEPPPPAREAGAVRQSAAPQPRRSAAPSPRPESRPRRAPVDEADIDKKKACETAAAVLSELFALMGVPAKADCRWDENQARVRADITTEDDELLVGQEGRTIESFQFLVTVITGRRMGVPVAVQVEVAEYWKDKEARVLAQVETAVAEVRRTGRPYRFDPMEPAIRRLIHRTLAESTEVETCSEGEGPRRKVVLRPRRK